MQRHEGLNLGLQVVDDRSGRPQSSEQFTKPGFWMTIEAEKRRNAPETFGG
jgi:hypothetical protein